ncbi:hypothetical protein [Microbacterium sp.]|uniref:hypothetical protein n=1 Tax=Microbacterium sp. TaxID=51671 RepID=UPI0039E726DE
MVDSDDEFEELALAAERGELARVPGTTLKGEELATLLEGLRAEHGDDVEGFLRAFFDLRPEG